MVRIELVGRVSLHCYRADANNAVRFHFMWEYLGLPWKDVELESREKPRAKI